MEKKERSSTVLWSLLATVGFAVVCFLFFQLTYPYHFYFKGQNQLFLMSWSYAGTLMAKPAWAACLVGEFLTQFYYYDYAGAMILTVTLTVLCGLTYLAVERLRLYKWTANRWVAIVAALAVTLREASCHLYFGYVLSSTYALMGGVALFLVLRRLMRRRWPWALAAVLPGTLLCYWMFGYGVWAFLLLSAMTAWRVAVPVALSFTALLPLTRSYYNLTFTDLCQYPGIGTLHTPNYHMETDLRMMHSYDVGDWDDVVKTAEADPLLNQLKEKGSTQHELTPDERVSSSVRLFFYNLVQAQRGRLPDVLMTYTPNYLGTFTQMVGQQIPMMMFMNMHEFYYAINDISNAEKAALVSCITVPGNKNAYTIRRLAECEMTMGEQAATDKYLGLLRKTIPYRKWAMQAPHDGKYQEKAKLMIRQDSILPDANSYKIISQLLRANPRNEVALDYMLCSFLQVKEIDNFKRDFDRYYQVRRHMPRLYQEALCIWLVSHEAEEEVWQNYIEDQEVVDRLEGYMDNSEDPRYNDTYWYYYDHYNFEPY